MKIYWRRLIWVYIIRHLYKLIYHHKSEHWKVNHGLRDWIWNSKQWVECEEAMASFLPKLDDVLRKATTRDNALTTAVTTMADQKVYKDGKVIAIKSLTQQSNQ